MSISIIITTGLLLVILSAPVKVIGQIASVRNLRAETVDGIVFNLRVRHQTVVSGQDAIIYYSVENRSRRNIYLVQQSDADIVNDRGTITIEPPRPLPYDHGGYDYMFTKIAPNRIHRGQVSIPNSQFHMKGMWNIEVGFSCVTDIKGLNRRLKRSEDPIGLRTLLDRRIRTVLLGELSIEAK